MTDERPGAKERTERLQVLLSKEELALIDDFRFRARMPTRAAAVRELMRRGLSAAAGIEKTKPPVHATISEARQKILKGQAVFIERLLGCKRPRESRQSPVYKRGLSDLFKLLRTCEQVHHARNVPSHAAGGRDFSLIQRHGDSANAPNSFGSDRAQ
jgi:hypothetical protein